jgi:hypothetical protein
MAGPNKVKGESRHHKKKNCSARKKGVAGKKVRALGQEESDGNGPISHRKYLQDDELVDYALGRSDLFYPCLALSEFVK